MKKLVLLLGLMLSITVISFAQVRIGGPGDPDPNAVLDLDGANGKGLLLPRISNAQMTAMNTATNGMIVYNTSDAGTYIRKSGTWVKLGEGGSGLILPHTGTYNLVTNYVLDVYNNTGLGAWGAIMGRANEGTGVTGTTNFGKGVVGTANIGIGGYFSANNGYPAIQTGTGTVCIGTPIVSKAKLMVHSDMTNTAAMFGYNTPGISLEVADAAVAFNSYVNSARKSMADGYGGYITLSPITGKFRIYTSPAPGTPDDDLTTNLRLSITKEGNIGFQGNADPHSPLSFADNLGNKISLWGNSPSSHYGFGIQPSLLQMYSGTVNDDIAFGYGSSAAFTENMRITGDGNVGIRTSNPVYPVTLVASGNGFVQKSGTIEIGTATTINGGMIKTYSNHPLQFATNNNSTPQMSLLQSGKVAIGTTFPVTQLHVRSTESNLFAIENSTALESDVETRMMFRTGNTYTGAIGTIGASLLAARMGFYTNVTPISSSLVERMSILDNGNVGINTITPASKLEVNGKAKVTQGANDNAALEIAGSIRLSGPNKAAFQVTVSSGTSSIIDNPLCNNDPSALLFVTSFSDEPVWISYDGNIGKWRLNTGGDRISGFTQINLKECDEDCKLVKILLAGTHSFSAGQTFNILVFKTSN